MRNWRGGGCDRPSASLLACFEVAQSGYIFVSGQDQICPVARHSNRAAAVRRMPLPPLPSSLPSPLTSRFGGRGREA